MAEEKQNSRSKKFLKDFGIYAIGVFGSNIITFLMIPLYTYFIEKPSDYGYFDLCFQVCMILVPIVTLQLRDGAYRYLLETKDIGRQTQIVSFVYRTILQTTFTTICIAIAISLFYPIRYLWLSVTLLITMSFYEMLAQTARGLGNNKAFISMALSASFGIGLFSLIFVAGLNMGIEGIFLANIFARLLSITIVETWMRTFSRFFRIRTDIKKISREIIKYSIPLIPVTLCGLLPPLSDRLFLKYFVGFEQAGIYAISVRITGIIHSISIIFYQTWQENAIQQYHNKDRDSFFSNIFNGYLFVIVIVLISYIFIMKILFPFIIGPSYQKSVNLLLPVSVYWSAIAISNYFYIPYQCAKDTKSAVPSVIILVISNITLNFLLVPIWGVMGIIATNLIGYTLVVIYLWLDTKKYFRLHILKNSIVPLSILLISPIPYYYNSNSFVDIAFIVISLAIIGYSIPNDIKRLILSKIKKVAPK